MSGGSPPRDAKDSRDPGLPEPPSTVASEGWAVLSTLIAGIAVWAAIGYGLDRLLGTGFLFPVGMVLGMIAAIYLVVVKYGRPQ